MRFAVYTVFVVIDHACQLRPPPSKFPRYGPAEGKGCIL